jgi:hypothetical protein
MILIGCEESQTICGEFRKAGYECFSNDIQPTRGNPEWHIQGDIMDVLPRHYWDLVILHPDCTKLAVCGNSTYGRGKPRHQERIDALEWTIDLWDAMTECANRGALENPASIIFRYLQAPTYWIQPWQFGHMEQKKTGLALHNLDPLKETKNVYKEMMQLPRKERERIHYMSPSSTRARDRSETYKGIAQAIVNQWGPLLSKS